MPKLKAIATITDGRVVNRDDIKRLFESLKDGKWIIEITTAKKRTSPQNRYYWGLVVPMVKAGIEDLGTELTSEETHELLKARFNTTDVVNETTGECINIPRSTSRLTTVEFMEYIERIQRFSAEFLNVVIPDPGQQMELEMPF